MKEKQLLDLIIPYCGHYVTGSFLSSQLMISKKTLQKLIVNLNLILIQYDAQIIAKRNKGYCFQIKEEKELKKIYALLKHDEENILFITKKLLEDDYVKSEDLQELLYINSSTLTKNLKEVRRNLCDYHLELISRPYYGLHIEGSEFHKRLCLCHYYLSEHQNFQQDNADIMNAITDIVFRNISNEGYELADDLWFNLILHLTIAYLRVLQHKDVMVPLRQEKELREKKEYQLASHILEDMEKKFQIHFDKSEIAYVTIHLLSKETIHGNTLMDIPKDIDLLICEMLKYVDEMESLHLSDNLELRVNLGLHMVPLIERIRYGTILKNPLFDKVKVTLIKGYEIAMIAKDVIENKYHCQIDEQEISYLAIHFHLALQAHKKKHKKNVLLICSTGRGTAQLLRFNFEKQFHNEINILDTCASEELTTINIHKYDYIFTTLDIPLTSDIPVIHIQYLMNQDEIGVIREILTANQAEYFSEDLFIPHLEAQSREEVLLRMFQHLKKVKHVPNQFYDELIKRENQADTTLGKNAAFPHPNHVVVDETFACIAILDKAVLWGSKEVRLVVMASIRRKGILKDEGFFRIISEFLSDEYLIQRLIAYPSYVSFKKIVQEINRKEE